MPADPVAAGRKGGRSKSPAKLAACRKNGFQKVKPGNPQTENQAAPVDSTRPVQGAEPLFIVPKGGE